MDGRGGCCIERYAGGAYDTSKIDRIMLRFRPIAPKPAVGGSLSGGSSSSPEKMNGNNDFVYRTGRAKRKYVRDSSNRRCSKKKRLLDNKTNNSNSNDPMVTLPLLPEKPVEKDTPTTRSPPSDSGDLTAGTKPTAMYVPMWLKTSNSSTHGQDHQGVMCGAGDRTVMMPQPVRPVGSCIIVECVTDVCSGGGLGRGDEDVRTNLERDTCPGLISDGWDRVEWTNEAYRKMVSQEVGDHQGPEMVWLVMKERLPYTCPAFTCRVRLQYTCRKERFSLTVPCDVWKMNCGGFAWRLDVKAALSLGRCTN